MGVSDQSTQFHVTIIVVSMTANIITPFEVVQGSL